MTVTLRLIGEMYVSDQFVVFESYLPAISILEEEAGLIGVMCRPGLVSDFDGVFVWESAECVTKVQRGSRL